MIPTPDLSHLTRDDFDKVYEPAEDTFLLLDALEQDEQWLQSLRPTICLEIGSGSGCVSTFLAKVVGVENAVFLTTDINPHACRATKQTGHRNGVARIEPVQTSLVEGLLPRLAGRVDVMCFNPPYVVTTPDEVGSHGIEAAWAGGVDGRQVIDEFLPFVPRLLSPHGVLYLLLINENRPQEVAAILRGEHGLQAEIILDRRAGRERQYILKASHPR